MLLPSAIDFVYDFLTHAKFNFAWWNIIFTFLYNIKSFCLIKIIVFKFSANLIFT